MKSENGDINDKEDGVAEKLYTGLFFWFYNFIDNRVFFRITWNLIYKVNIKSRGGDEETTATKIRKKVATI